MLEKLQNMKTVGCRLIKTPVIRLGNQYCTSSRVVYPNFGLLYAKKEECFE